MLGQAGTCRLYIILLNYQLRVIIIETQLGCVRYMIPHVNSDDAMALISTDVS